MDRHRRVPPTNVKFYSVTQPFSSFDFVEGFYGGAEAIRRLFSLARSFEAKTLVCENIPATGIVADENQEIKSYYTDFTGGDLQRLSFWSKTITSLDDFRSCTDEHLVGFAIVKCDMVPTRKYNGWHVFESVFRKYQHTHNCVPLQRSYTVSIGGFDFKIPGLLYCQQNTLNKACAHVALRSLLSRLLPDGDISYSALNGIAGTLVAGYLPQSGLNVPQIRKILDTYGIRYRDIDYDAMPAYRTLLPYQKMAYAGVESGAGSLVGFSLSGSGSTGERHIVPFYGHTFNKDTWAPDADVAYFHVGDVRYVPSESWTSSFLGHDDNFGPNFCIPRLYVGQDKVDYVVEILLPGVHYGGVEAEILGLQFLYAILPHMQPEENRWLKRLINWTAKQRVVLRALCLEKAQYCHHLQTIRDWEGIGELPQKVQALTEDLPGRLWIIEISTPQLYPANERKLGEIVLSATVAAKDKTVFQFARLPGKYLLSGDVDDRGTMSFLVQQSNIQSHTELCSFN